MQKRSEKEDKYLSELLKQFYSEHNPEKIKDIPELVQDCLSLGVLNQKLCEKYGNDLCPYVDGKGECLILRAQSNSDVFECIGMTIETELLLDHFYRKHNPSKIQQAREIAEQYAGDIENLNKDLMRVYGEDLSGMLNHHVLVRAKSKQEAVSVIQTPRCPISGQNGAGNVFANCVFKAMIRASPNWQAPSNQSLSIEEASKRLKILVVEAQSSGLSSRDIAIIKEGWNKALAFRDKLFFEALSRRWIFLRPDATTFLGHECEDLEAFLYSWIDLAVHNLAPETEILHRETFAPVHTFVQQRFQTVESHALHLAAINLDANSILGLDEAWYFALQTHTPYFEKSDVDELKNRDSAPLVRFFRQHVLGSFHDAQHKLMMLADAGSPLKNLLHLKKVDMGRIFLGRVFDETPELINHFSEVDVDKIGSSFMECIALILSTEDSKMSALPALRALGEENLRIRLPIWGYACMGKNLFEMLVEEARELMTPDVMAALILAYDIFTGIVSFPQYMVEKLAGEANEFFDQAAQHFGWPPQSLTQRKLRALRDIYALGSHELSEQELSFGAQLAWRNSGKCSGRISWNTLLVRDCRHVEDAELMFHECVEHQRLATAGTSMQSVMTVFRPKSRQEGWGPRIWNAQFIRFACWELADGSVLGDPANRELTAHILKHFPHWTGPATKSAFDVLPIVIEVPGQAPKLFEVPNDVATLVHIEHPDNPRVAGLGFKWCAVPTITNFNLRLAGIDFVCCPFNGWFLNLEVVRDLLDRYDGAARFVEVFPDFLARKNTGDSSWLDSILVEMCRAVSFSFHKNNVSMVDRATISAQFSMHLERERKEGREVPAQWSWIGGLLGCAYPSWKHECRDFVINPQYQYQSDIFIVAPGDIVHMNGEEGMDPTLVMPSSLKVNVAMKLWHKRSLERCRKRNLETIMKKGISRVSILFGSETGAAESYALKLAEELKLLSPSLATLNDASSLEGRKKFLLTDVVLIITSTFGNGDAPFNANKFLDPESPEIPNLSRTDKGTAVRLAVCGLGSSAYPDFAEYGKRVWSTLRKAGADALLDIVLADEMAGQYNSFEVWMHSVRAAILPIPLMNALKSWNPAASRVVVRSRSMPATEKFEANLYFVHSNREQYRLCPIIHNTELRRQPDASSGRSTHRIEIDIGAIGSHAYTTGDNCAILPVKPFAHVEEICMHLQVLPQDCIEALLCTESNIQVGVHGVSEHETILIGGVKNIILGPNNATPYQGMTWMELFSVVVETTLNSSFIIPLLELLVESASLSPHGKGALTPDKNKTSELAAIKSELEEVLMKAVLSDKTKFHRISQPTVSNTAGRSVCDFIDKYIDLRGLFRAFPEHAARLDLAKLLQLLPKNRPRYYSISSSSELYPTLVALTVGLVVETTSQGTLRRGVCSNYLCDAPIGHQVLLSIRPSSFRLPADPKTPIICVGPGTGIAPFVGFMQERMMQNQSQQVATVRSILFTGARTEADVIYTDEIKDWEESKIIRVQIALSRVEPRQRVQDAIKKSADEVLKLLLDDTGILYCCGDARMVDDTLEAFVGMIAAKKGISALAAKEIILALRDLGRYQTSTWGLTKFFSQGATLYENKKSAQSKDWLYAMLGPKGTILRPQRQIA